MVLDGLKFVLPFFFFATVQVQEHGSCSVCLKQKNLTHTQLLSPYIPMSDIINPSQHSFSLNSDEALESFSTQPFRQPLMDHQKLPPLLLVL